MNYDLNARESKIIDRMRMTADQRNLANLAEIEVARQSRLSALSSEARAIAEQKYIDNARTRAVDEARIATLTREEIEAERLVKRQENLTLELDKVKVALAKPTIAAIINKVKN